MVDREQYDEIITRLARIESGVEKTNGRVTTLETSVSDLRSWRDNHEPLSAQTRTQLAELTDAVAAMRGEVTATLEACVVSPAMIRASVAQVLDERSITDDANRWRAVVAGARAIGWRVVVALVTFSAAGLAGFLTALWRVV